MNLERGSIERSKDELKIVLPTRGSILPMLAVLVWCGVMVVVIGGNVTVSELKLALPIVLVFAAVLAVALIAILGLVLWVAAGQEIITVRDGVLELSRRVPGRRFDVRAYSIKAVHEMREDAPGDVRPVTRGWSHLLGLVGGTIAFEYEGVTHRFGSRLGPGDAHTVIANIMATSGVNVDEASADLAYREATVVERGRGILIEVPPARVNSVTTVSLMFLFIIGVMIAMLTGAAMSGNLRGNVAALYVVFPVLVVVIGGWALLSLIANLWRRETVAVDEHSIVIIRHVLGMDFRTELAIVPEAKLWHDVAHGEEPRMTGGPRPGVAMTPPFNVGPIVYQGAQGQLFRFGNGLAKSEAAFLVSRIHAKSPTLIN